MGKYQRRVCNSFQRNQTKPVFSEEECPHTLGILRSSGLTVFPVSEVVIFSPSGLPPTFPDSQKVDECQRLGHPGPFLVTARASKTLPQVPIGQRVSHPS